MMGTDVPAVFAGPFTDSIIEAAGGVNSFDGFKTSTTRCRSTPRPWRPPTSTCSSSACTCPTTTPTHTPSAVRPVPAVDRLAEQVVHGGRRERLPRPVQRRRDPEDRRCHRRRQLTPRRRSSPHLVGGGGYAVLLVGLTVGLVVALIARDLDRHGHPAARGHLVRRRPPPRCRVRLRRRRCRTRSCGTSARRGCCSPRSSAPR